MRAIYAPRGRAAEYSPLALNLYRGCDHGCKYCYGPRVLRMTFEEYQEPRGRVGIDRQIRKELGRVDPTKQILLSFIGDPYCHAEMTRGYTREALEILWWARNPIAILTKGGRHCLRDLELFVQFGSRIKVGASLTFEDASWSRTWEPGAASPQDRISTLWALHSAGVRTWVSMEPVISSLQSLALLEQIPFVDEIRLGKLNNYQGRDRAIAWDVYLKEALAIAGSRAIVKKELQEAADAVHAA